MSIKYIYSIISIGLSALLAYALYTIYKGEHQVLLSTFSLLFLATTMIMTVGIRFQLPRTATNVRAVSGIFFFISLICNVIFAFTSFSIAIYVIVNGLLFLVYILIAYSVITAKQ